MKKELIAELFEQLENAKYEKGQLEFWSAREYQEILGYTKWDNFLKVIDKGKSACENSSVAVSDHFADPGNMVTDLQANKIQLTGVAKPGCKNLFTSTKK